MSKNRHQLQRKCGCGMEDGGLAKMTKHIPHLMPYLVSVVVLTSMSAFLPTSSDALSYAPRAFSGDFSTQSYPKREASVFEIRGKRKIGLVLTTWPSLDGTVEFEESYYETGDLGATWRRVERSDVLDDPTEIGPHPADPRTIYRVHDAHDLTTFFLEKSSDDGKTWQKVDGRIRSTPEGLKSYSFLAFHPEDPATLYVSGPILGGDEATGPIGLYVSHDKGSTFSLLAANIDQLKFAISKSKPETIYACTFHQYLIKSDDGGRVLKFAGPCNH